MVIARRGKVTTVEGDLAQGPGPAAGRTNGSQPHSGSPAAEEPPPAGTVREDQLLLAAVAARDQVALRRLYERHGGLLLHIAFEMVRSWESAEEVVQDVFIQCWNRADTYRSSRGTPTAWLVSMTRSRAIDHLRFNPAAKRGAGQRVSLDGLPDRFVSLDPPPGSRLEIGELGAALLELPREMRTAIMLSAYGGLTHQEIADLLETPSGTVKSWIRRGLLRLRVRLQQGVIPNE
jgi:RNA polymerase sigma-70 factor (ECF subfamily)